MSYMSEMDACITDLKSAADALLGLAKTLTAMYSAKPPIESVPEEKPITKEEVRAELAAKSALGYGAQVRALLKKHGATQLSAVDPTEYRTLLTEAVAIGNEEVGNG